MPGLAEAFGDMSTDGGIGINIITQGKPMARPAQMILWFYAEPRMPFKSLQQEEEPLMRGKEQECARFLNHA